MASDGVEIAKGNWHPPNSSVVMPATLLADGKRISIRLDNDGSVVCRDDLLATQVSDRIGNIPRRLTLSNDSLFETSDNNAIDNLLKAHRANRTGWIADLEQFRPRLIGFVVIVFLLATLIYRYAVPALVEVAILVTPPVVPQWLSSGTLASLDQTMLAPSKLPVAEQQKIRAGFDEIAGFSTRGKAGYKLNFRDGGYIGPNAFALPDGTLVITDQLVELAKGDTELVLGVLAHEIGHVEKDHSLRQLYRVAGVAGLIMLIAGDIGAGAEEVLTDGAALLALSHSRSAESEADRISVELMAKAGHDPAAIGRFFKLLEDRFGDNGGTSMLSTHPGTPERRQQIDEWAKEVVK